MIYSVYDYRKKTYSYYQAQGEAPATGWFRSPAGREGGQITPETIAAKVPPGAQCIGEGPNARGIVATTFAGLGQIQRDRAGAGVNSLGERIAGLGEVEAAEAATKNAALAIGALALGWYLWRRK